MYIFDGLKVNAENIIFHRKLGKFNLCSNYSCEIEIITLQRLSLLHIIKQTMHIK